MTTDKPPVQRPNRTRYVLRRGDGRYFCHTDCAEMWCVGEANAYQWVSPWAVLDASNKWRAATGQTIEVIEIQLPLSVYW